MWREVCGVGIQLILILVKSKCAEAGTKFIGQDQLEHSKDFHPTRLHSNSGRPMRLRIHFSFSLKKKQLNPRKRAIS